MKALRGTFGLATVMLALFGTSFVGVARAATVGCGDIVTESIALDTDIGPCGTGITIAANGVTLDLAGHTVTGAGARLGNTAGVIFDGTRGSKVINGTVRRFDAGVVIDGGSNNLVQGVRAVDNIGGGEFGDGIFVFMSDNSRLLNNQVSGNGPFSGITLDDSSGVLVDGNAVQSNGPTNTTIGIWILNDRDVPASQGDVDLVGRQASFNVVSNNQVQGNGLDGIQISRFSHDNTVRLNNVSQNGVNRTNGVRDGSGIIDFGNQNLIEDNVAFGNGANGIAIQASTSAQTGRPQGINNTIRRNRSVGNNIGPNPAPNFDLLDQNPNCDNNQWHGNFGQTFSPPCTLNP